MKTIKFLSVFLFISIALVSCNKSDDDGGDGGGAPEGTMTAKINGSSFTSMEIATTANEVTAGGSTTITIQGSDADGKGMVLIINTYDGTGTYTISDDNVFTSASYVEANVSNPQASQTWQAPFQDSGVVGEIKIAEKTDSNIKGTFNFEAKNSNDGSMRNVTEGSFNMGIMQN